MSSALWTAWWRLLRQPFILPLSICKKCKWECFADDMAGCVWCGAVHHCGVSPCQNVVQTEDAMVCEITGIVAKSKIFSEMEFSESVIVYSENTPYFQQQTSIIEDVYAYVYEILLSSNAEQVLRQEKIRAVCRLYSSMITELNTNLRKDKSINILSLIEKGMLKNANFRIKVSFDVEMRNEVAVRATDAIRKFVVCTYMLETLRIRPSELRGVVIGLLYLLRTGIHFEGHTVLPQISELQNLLPLESSLNKFKNFHARMITEVENRVKFTIRSMKPHQIRSFLVRVDNGKQRA